MVLPEGWGNTHTSHTLEFFRLATIRAFFKVGSITEKPIVTVWRRMGLIQ